MSNANAAANELEALRHESANARAQQQAILQWSIGALSLLFAAALAAGPASSGGSFETLIAFGVVIPGVAIGASFAWLGEVIRMERVGRYLRGRERAFWPDRDRLSVATPSAWVQNPGAYPTLWENHIAFGDQSRRATKQLVGYVGGLWIYAGSVSLSLGLFIGIIHANGVGDASEWVATGYAGAVLASWFGYFVTQSKSLVDLGVQAAGVFDHRKVTWAQAIKSAFGRPMDL